MTTAIDNRKKLRRSFEKLVNSKAKNEGITKPEAAKCVYDAIPGLRETFCEHANERAEHNRLA